MKEFMKSMKWKMLLFGLLTLAVGIALIARPDVAAKTVCMIIGIVLMIAGLVYIIMYAVNKEKSAGAITTLILGVIELACGIIIAMNINTFVNFLGIICAIVLLLHSINDIAQSVSIKKMGYTTWKTPLIFGLVGVGFALIIFFNPMKTFSALMTLVGISLVVDGVSDMFISFRVGRCAKNYIDPDKVVEVGDDAAEVVDEEVAE